MTPRTTGSPRPPRWGIAFGLLAGIGLGVAMGLGLGGGHPATPADPRDRAESAEPAIPESEEDERSSRDLPPVPAASERVEVRRAAPAAAEAPEDTLEGAVHSVATLAPVEGKIEGKVRTQDGTPLAGALVRATGSFPRPAGARRGRRDPLEEPDVSRRIREILEEDRWRRATRRETRTDASGSYALEDLAGTRYSVAAGLEGYEIRAAGRSSGVEPGGRVDFVAWEVVELPVLVLLPDGRPAEAAELEIESEGRGRTVLAWSPGDPTVPVTSGAHALAASVEGPPELRSKRETVLVEEGIIPPPLSLRLEPRSGIRGRVVFPEGEEPEQAVVYTMRLLGDRDEEALRRDGTRTGVRRGWSFGFELLDLPAGTYLVGVALDDQRPLARTETVEVTDGVVDLDLPFPPLDPREFVLLRVLDPKGRTLRDVRITTGIRGSRGSSSGSAVAVAKEDGTFLVMHAPRGPDADGVDLIRVRSSRYGEKEAEYLRERVSEVTIAFEEAAMLEASVAGYDGSGLEGSLGLQLRRASAGRGGGWSPFYDPDRRGLDAEGRRTFGPVQPGACELVLGLREAGNRMRPIEVLPVALGPGENRQVVPIPPLYRLVVLVEDASPGAQVVLEPRSADRGRWSARERIGEDGRAAFRRLLAGEYRLTLGGGKRPRRMTVSLPGPDHVVFGPE